MNIQIFYDNGNYETFSTPPMSFEEGRYTIENTFLQLTEMLNAKTEEDMRITLERCYWTVEDGEGKEDFTEGYQVDVPARILKSSELAAVLAIVVDGICMIARCEGKLRSWLDPEFENPMVVGFDVERMTGGWNWPETMSVSRPEGVNFKPKVESKYENQIPIATDGEETTPEPDTNTEEPEFNPTEAEEELLALEELYPGINEEDEDF